MFLRFREQWLLIMLFLVACTISSVLLFRKEVCGRMLSWAEVLAPLYAACALKVLVTLRVLATRVRDEFGGQLSQEATPLVCQALDAGCQGVFYFLLQRHLEGRTPRSVCAGVFSPVFASMAQHLVLKTALWRPQTAPGAHTRLTAEAVLKKTINEQAALFFVFYYVGKKLDGDSTYSWATAFVGFWIPLAFAWLFVVVAFCLARGQAGEGRAAFCATGCVVLPNALLFTLFLAFLTERLEGERRVSTHAILALLVAFQVVLSLTMLLLTLGIEAHAHSEGFAQRAQRGMAEHHAGDAPPSTLEQVGGRERARGEEWRLLTLASTRELHPSGDYSPSFQPLT